MAEGKKGPSRENKKELGLWVDTHMVNKHLKQPTQSMFTQRRDPAGRLRHFADLALGSTKPDEGKAEKISKKVSKKRQK